MKKIALEEHFWTDSLEAARFIEAAPIGEPERELICWKNAEGLLRL
jgi:hypothetical protein